MTMKQEDPTSGGSVSSRLSCDVDTTPTRHVRQLVRNMLGDRHDIVADDAVLVADERATNRLRHAEPPRHCRIGLTNHGQHLRIEVDDAAPTATPQLQTPDRSGGRGLVLVDQLTSAWGVNYHPGGRTVWAELA